MIRQSWEVLEKGMAMPKGKKPNTKRYEELLDTLKSRFDAHPQRHPGVEWKRVQTRLEADPNKLASLSEMEKTGGEPDVVGSDTKTGEIIFMDCSAESPGGRRSLCYDRQAWESRKENRPSGNVLDAAARMGSELLTEGQYRQLQSLGKFDQKTSSWVLTPAPIRRLGGAIFCDRRYDTIFVYHNGADSYYAARGFRTVLKV